MKFTALMPIHESVKLNLLKKAIISVLSSETIPNEFLMIIDGKISLKKKKFLLKIKNKNKVVNIIFKKKLGLVNILNEGLKLAKYDIVARVDSDDLNDKLRFKKQIDFFKKNKIDILGTNTMEITDKKIFLRNMPSQPRLIHLLFYNPLNHMTIMYNRKKILALGGYPKIKFKEDYALWILAIFKKYRIQNINKPLVSCNININTFSRRKSFQAILSEYLIFKLIVSKNIFLFPLCIFTILFRIIFLLIPIPIYLFVKNRINS